MSSVESYECPNCHAHSNKTWHRITPGLVRALLKLRTAVRTHRRNDIDIHHEMTLTTTEAMNWTKLRFHGLVAKVRVDDEVQRGHWLLTRKGRDFLNGELMIAARVRTMNNHIIERDTLVVDVEQVFGSRPSFENFDSIERERVAVCVQQSSLFESAI